MSTRAEKVASLLKREVTQTIQRELSDPRIEGLVSITRVKVTDDLRDATVYVSVLPAQHGRKVVAALVDGTRHIQKVTQTRVALRTMPRLAFRLDESLKKESGVLAAIQEANRRTDAADPPPPGEGRSTPQEDRR